ncbi:hypothetical protein F4859DRAFT_491174 [Xylaria cf. heliscus]|nr:hypothetical protein F4859DRAFT_491174 [Xylaria cf. heliscus]
MAEIGGGAEVQLKRLHPFFSAPNADTNTNTNTNNTNTNTIAITIHKADDAVTPPTPDPSCSPASDESGNDPIEHYNHHDEPQERKRKRRKTDPSSGASETLPRAPRTKRRVRVSAGPSIIKHFSQTLVKDTQAQDHGQIREASNGHTNQLPYLSATNGCDPVRDDENQEVSQSTCGQKPQKLLKFNPTTGTIGSPPRAKPAPAAISTTGRKRGRKPKAFVVTISYGIDAESRERVSQRINGVLLGTTIIPPSVSIDAVPKTPSSSHDITNDKVSGILTPEKHAAQKTATPKKPAHPFFQAKGKVASSNDDRPKLKKAKSSTRQVIFTSTPCSPKQVRSAPSSSSLPTLGSKKGSLKVPGAQYPAWPWRDMVHVRDNSSPEPINDVGRESIPINPRERKAKGQSVHIAEHESILCKAASKLGIRQLTDDIKLTNDEEFYPVASSVRVPTKHFESGRKLQARVFQELRTLTHHGALMKTHPAITHAYDSIATTLSAFDASTCESVAWAQKYAPTSARCVLQNGREAELLRDWLQSLKVQAVDTGASDNASKLKSVSAPRKKRRHKKLEGFVVSSDEEANDMDEIDDDESQWFCHGNRGDAKKTVVRSGDMIDRGGKPSTRLTNAVLISGPHGCGKTATVYAIAKELDFEVFEINAGARRSGKDILEKVGDMTRNHLVNHQQKDEPRDSTVDDEVNRDLKSGKQGMMTCFFKPKPARPTKDAQVVAQTLETPVPASQEKKPNRDQKQSLILLEEVDILYEEDKQFWATVISMIAQSKRPFIMTCNNESIVPIQTLKLHGIFRFSSPPVDLAVDMLLLIAANEGHALRRRAVEALYESRDHDLRAAITELNYWCQIGVGDLRGGFDWFYPRWPKGSDVDEQGQTIRVVSEDTYHAGMGWLNRDLATIEPPSSAIIPDLHQEAWDHWGVDVSDHHEFEDSSSWAKKATEQASSRADRLALLQAIERFTESVSESDVCGPFLSPLSNHINLDATIPDLHSKTLDDFTVGNKVLEVAPLCHYNSISLGVSTSLRFLAQSQLMGNQVPFDGVCPARRFDETRVTRDIEYHLSSSLRSESPIKRKDYSIAFDPIAASEKILANGYLDPSVFDREMTPLCLDVAPYVRSIVSYDQRLNNERRTRSNLLSEGGRPEKKRMRTTRAALSALEGSSRATTRRERYFAADINPYLVMRTGGQGWGDLVIEMGATEENFGSPQMKSDTDMHATSDES